MFATHFAKTGQLLRLNLRRDWLKITCWLIGLVGLMAGAAAKFNGLYGTPKTMGTIITTLKTPAMVSLLGPFTAKAPYSVALVYAAEMMVFMGLFTAMMNIYFAIHATRADEDSGVLELIRAHSVGRFSALTAAIGELVCLNLLAGVLEALGLQASGMTGMDQAGNWLFGLGLAMFGLMFGIFSCFFAQVATSARGATILSYSWLGLLYVVRMGTDVKNPDATWWTIYGWIEKLDIYGQNHWLPVVLMLAMSLVIGTLTYAVGATRDVGAGLLPDRRGRRHASRFLAGPLSLVARLERTSTSIWLIGLLILGATYGSIFGTAGDLLKSNPMMAKLIGTAATDAANRAIVLSFANKLTIIFAVLATIPGLITVFRLNGDERKGYFEQLHARSVSRAHLYFAIAGFGLIVSLASFGLAICGMYLAGVASMGANMPDFSRFMRGFWGFAPALITSIGVGALLAGCLPKWQNITWILPAYGFFSLYLGALMNFPKWATQLTPFGWVNTVPLKTVNVGTAIWMTALGIALVVVGFAAYKRRDLLVN